MPKLVEQHELCNKCKWIWTSINGIYGYLVTSNISGYTDRSIFLPAAGFYSYSNLLYTGELGYYWSNCLDFNRPDGALTIFMNPAFKSTEAMGRSSGLSVRPVQ